MRRKISCIFILSVFLSLQFGKVVSYLYCKWQIEIVLNQPDCDCDDHLVALFDQSIKGENKAMPKNIFTEKITEFSHIFPVIDFQTEYKFINNSFARFSSPLPEIYIAAPFHPPIV